MMFACMDTCFFNQALVKKSLKCLNRINALPSFCANDSMIPPGPAQTEHWKSDCGKPTSAVAVAAVCGCWSGSHILISSVKQD